MKNFIKQINNDEKGSKQDSSQMEKNLKGQKKHQKKTTKAGNQQNFQETDYQDEDIEFGGEQNLNPNKPSDQLKLTEIQLNEEMTSKMLVPNNPKAPKNYTYYSFKDRKYVTDELVDQLQIHFSYDGDQILKDSNEAKIQEEILETRENLIKDAIRNQEAEDPGAPKEDIEVIKKTLRNKFNYNDRQSQTLNNPIREKGVSTEPPPSQNFSHEITQWEIFDHFYAEIQKENEQNTNKNLKHHGKETQEDSNKETSLYATTFKRCIKIMERMVVQNDQREKYHDYKYYWSKGTSVQETVKNEGHMLPLWRFSNEKQRKKNVTAIRWNPRYPDLFAVGLGSYDFLKQRMGLICLYSLKNTTHPDYSYSTESGVMSLDFHPESAALLAVGLYDGTVLVYDIRNKHKKAIYQSTVRTMKHTDPVWQVSWNPDISKKYNFYSISSDGRVMNWILMKNKLEPEEVIKLKLTGKNSDEEATSLIGLAAGLCFDFNKDPEYKHIFIVGTEEGKIHKCSRAYSGQYQETYKGHLLAVYKVRWNYFHSRTFISASADWTVKIWDSQSSSPIMNFDLQQSVVDALWAPYSGTVFATASLDKVYVYDLHVDKHGKLAEQKPCKIPKLTNLAFNQQSPLLLVGDTHGGVTLLKLSPNLTKGINAEGDIASKQKQEFDKMEALLKVVGKFEKDDV